MSVVAKTRRLLVVLIALGVCAAVVTGLQQIPVFTSTTPTPQTAPVATSGDLVQFQVEWSRSQPGRVRYDVGSGYQQVPGGQLHPDYHGWQSPTYVYNPRITYRLEVIQTDRGDNTRLTILRNNVLAAFSDNQHPPRTLIPVELRSS